MRIDLGIGGGGSGKAGGMVRPEPATFRAAYGTARL